MKLQEHLLGYFLHQRLETHKAVTQYSPLGKAVPHTTDQAVWSLSGDSRVCQNPGPVPPPACGHPSGATASCTGLHHLLQHPGQEKWVTLTREETVEFTCCQQQTVQTVFALSPCSAICVNSLGELTDCPYFTLCLDIQISSTHTFMAAMPVRKCNRTELKMQVETTTGY